MKILEKANTKQKDLNGQKPITIAFLGDSVTQGCFECYKTGENSLETIFDYKSAYSTRLKELLNLLYPKVQINIINSGISGDNVNDGIKRLDRDVLAFNPDLVVVSYGLNDSCCGGESNIENYTKTLKEILTSIINKGSECIFLTQNYMCTSTSCHISNDQLFKSLSVNFSKIQNDGILRKYFIKAKEICKELEINVCDLYEVWDNMEKYGINTTELLANKLNHPIREYHYYIAIKLIETMMM